MPRNEGFLDPDAGPLASFAWDLRALRDKAGRVPYRVLAKRAGFCASTLSVAASGSKLPSLDVTLAYVQACGGDPDAWRERWNTLATQHSSAHPLPHAHSGLQFAPPYDADESGEPARSGALPSDGAPSGTAPSPGLSPHGAVRADRELPIVVDPVPAAGRDDAPAEAAREVAVAAALAPRARRGHERWWRHPRPALSFGRLTTVALAVATAVLGVRAMEPAVAGGAPVTGPPPSTSVRADGAMQQADALYALIYQPTPFRSDSNGAIWDVNGCRNLSNAQSELRAIVRKRHEQVEQLAALDVSKIPGHERLVDALTLAWMTSAQAAAAYANIAADLQVGCTSGAIQTDPSYQQADAEAQAAAAAKAEAARLWNADTEELGQLPLTKDEL